VVVALHQVLANTLWMYLLACGLWGVLLYLRSRPVTSGYGGALVIGQAVVVLQGLLGVLLLVDGAAPRQGMHFLYGVASAVALPLAHVYAREHKGRNQPLLYGLACLFTFGLVLRAAGTA